MADETAVQEEEIVESTPGVIESDPDEIDGALYYAPKEPEPKEEPKAAAEEKPAVEEEDQPAKAEGDAEPEKAAETEEAKPAEEAGKTEPEAKAEGEEAAKAEVVPSPVDERLARFVVNDKIDLPKVAATIEHIEKEVVPFANFGAFSDRLLVADPELRVMFWKKAQAQGHQVPPARLAEIVEFDKKQEEAAKAEPELTDEQIRARHKELLLEDETKAATWLLEQNNKKQKAAADREAERERRRRNEEELKQQQTRAQVEADAAQVAQLKAVAAKYPSVLSFEEGKGFTVKDQAVYDEFCRNADGVSPKVSLEKLMRMTLKDMDKLAKPPAKKEEPKVEPRPALGKGKATVPPSMRRKAEPGMIPSDDDVIEGSWLSR